MKILRIFILFTFTILISGCGSSNKNSDNSRYYYYSNHTDKSYAGNQMRVKKLTPTQYRIRAYEKAKGNY